MSDSATHWQTRLDQLGGKRDADGIVRHFSGRADDDPQSTLIIGDQYAVIHVAGSDATAFLQGQLTTDMQHLADGHWRLAMHLDLKGRGQFSYLLLPANDGVLMLTERSRASDAIQALKKYALVSKVSITMQADQVVLMLSEPPADATLSGISLPALGHCHQGPHGILARLDPAHLLLVTNSQAASRLLDHYSVAELGGADHWQCQEMRLGLAHILPGGEGLWLPQMLNYDQHQGVSFNKGCYLGQEVVARMHFKGKLKQRLRHLYWQAELSASPGSILRDGSGQAVGELVCAVRLATGTEAQAVLKLDYSGELHLNRQPLDWHYLDL